MTQIDEGALEAAVKILNRRFAQDEFYITAAARCAITAYLEALTPPGDVGELGKPHMLDPATPVTHEEAFEIAKRFIDYRFGNENEVPRASIPCDLERDDDVRLHAYIRQNARLSARLAEVERLVQQREKELAATFCDDAKMKLLEKYNARAERLAAALRPLVEACESDFTSEATEAGVGRERDDEPVSFTVGGIGCSLTFGHIRAGRAALATPEPQG